MSRAAAAIEVWRDGRVESRHRLRWCLRRDDGRVLAAEGDTAEPVFPRSATKPLQALPLVAEGAADAFGLEEADIALACASHGGEPGHVARVARWLERLGLGPDALACGAHPPLHAESAAALLRAGTAPSPLYNNCSGKHAGMLTLARFLELPVAGYLAPEHPVQRRILAVLRTLADGAVVAPPAIDGCGVPTWAMPLEALALAAARFATGRGLAAREARAAARILAACRGHPWMIAGTGRPCTRILPHLAQGLVKTGAEGVYLAFLPEIAAGLALKVEDGAGRASAVALVALLDRLGPLDAAARRDLGDLFATPLLNHAGTPVGEIRPAAGWPPAIAR